MKVLFLILFFSIGCSTPRYYKAPEVAVELSNNSKQLEEILANVDVDYSRKEDFYYYQVSKLDKENYILHSLEWSLSEMRKKKESITSKASFLKELNDDLQKRLVKKANISEQDPLFKKIEKFSTIVEKNSSVLIEEYKEYKSAASDFLKFAPLANNITRQERVVMP